MPERTKRSIQGDNFITFKANILLSDCGFLDNLGILKRIEYKSIQNIQSTIYFIIFSG